MTDEYDNEGSGRYSVTLRRGDEERSVEICADSLDSAEHRAFTVASNEDYIIWNDSESDISVCGIDFIEGDVDEEAAEMDDEQTD